MLIEAVGRQPKKVADGARFVCDLKPPFSAFSKPRDGIGDKVDPHRRSLMPCGVIIRQIDGQIARIGAVADTECVTGHAEMIEAWRANVGSVGDTKPREDVHSSLLSNRVIRRPALRRAVYIRPRCHLHLYCRADHRCQTAGGARIA
jgi:hypothetical protein